jgi:hypothetical protein
MATNDRELILDVELTRVNKLSVFWQGAQGGATNELVYELDVAGAKVVLPREDVQLLLQLVQHRR